MDSSVSAKDEIWFLRVCHHVSNAVYNSLSLPRQHNTKVSAYRSVPSSDSSTTHESHYYYYYYYYYYWKKSINRPRMPRSFIRTAWRIKLVTSVIPNSFQFNFKWFSIIPLLGAFMKLRKATISFVMSDCLYACRLVRTEQIGFKRWPFE